MIRGGHFWVGLSTDRACVVVRTYMFNVNTSEPYRRFHEKKQNTIVFCRRRFVRTNSECFNGKLNGKTPFHEQ